MRAEIAPYACLRELDWTGPRSPQLRWPVVPIGTENVELIDNWQSAWRFWSVNIPAFGAGLLTTYIALPDSLRDLIPHRVAEALAVVIVLTGAGARIVKQPTVSPNP